MGTSDVILKTGLGLMTFFEVLVLALDSLKDLKNVRTFWRNNLQIFRNLWCVRTDKGGGGCPVRTKGGGGQFFEIFVRTSFMDGP